MVDYGYSTVQHETFWVHAISQAHYARHHMCHLMHGINIKKVYYTSLVTKILMNIDFIAEPFSQLYT